MIDTERIGISLEVGCSQRCDAISAPLLLQLRRGRYERCSVLEIPDTVIDWAQQHRTARRRAKRAGDRGYHWAPLARENHADEIHAVNTSTPKRQGRTMDAPYWERQEFSPLPEYPCERHAIRCTGIWAPDEDVTGYAENGGTQIQRGALVGYVVVYRCGDLALVSQILGHARHLENEIMYLLFAGALTRETLAGPGMVVYNRHDSGTDGLRFFKERLGFEEAPVSWLP